MDFVILFFLHDFLEFFHLTRFFRGIESTPNSPCIFLHHFFPRFFKEYIYRVKKELSVYNKKIITKYGRTENKTSPGAKAKMLNKFE